MRSLLLLFLSIAHLPSATVWSFNNPDWHQNPNWFNDPNFNELYYFKPPNADETNSAFWDRISPSVAITRRGSSLPQRGIFNPLAETEYQRSFSPAGTAWAFLGRNGNPSDAASLIASNYTNLTFLPFEDAHGGASAGNDGTLRNIIDRPAVLHIIAEDIYLDIRFTDWANRNQNIGVFGYVRAQAIPEPSTAFLLALAPLLMLRSRP
ncbi:MAG: hypothetical protein AAGC74_13380 [Verrucomicrobiota bacterium]